MAIEDELLRMRGRTAFYDAFHPPDVHKRDYDWNELNMGVDIDGKPFVFKMKEGVRITCIGMNGSGKTWLIRAFMDRLYRTKKYNIAILPDVKAEFNSSNKPAPQGQHQFYAQYEVAAPLELLSFKPTFFERFRVKIPVSLTEFPISFKVEDLSYVDFKDIFNISQDGAVAQYNFIDKLCMRIQNGEVSIRTFEDIKEQIESCEYLKEDSKMSLISKVERIFLVNFFGDTHYYNPVDILNDGKVFALNMEFFDSISKEAGPPQLAVNLCHRMICNARKNDLLTRKRVFFIMDEAARFVPSQRDTAVKLDILEAIELLRAYHINYFFSYQTIGSVPESILTNSQYILVPRKADIKTFKAAFKNTGFFLGADNQLEKYCRRFKNQIDNFDPHAWAVFDKNNGNVKIVKFYAPLSKHDSKT